MQRRGRMLTLWFIGVALGVSACSGDDPEPIFAPAGDTSSGPTAGSSTAPAAAKRETPREFIHRWNEIDQRMQTTGDTTEYLKVSQGCRPCRRTAAAVVGYYEAGGHIEWDGREISKIEHIGSNTYDVWFDIAPTHVKESGAATPQTISGGAGKMRFVLARRGDAFVLAGLTRRPVS